MFHFLKDDTHEKLSQTYYDPKKDPPLYDPFGPVTPDCVHLPKSVTVEWIDCVEDLEKLDVLLKEPMIGVDSEWRPQLSKKHNPKPSLFQISGKNCAFLIDFAYLGNNIQLDKKLTQIFCNPKSLIIGFSFNHDIDMLCRKFPKM